MPARKKTPKDRDVAKIKSRKAFANKLRRLADKIEDGGAFSLMVEGHAVRVPATARFSIEHEREGADEEVELQMSWKNKPGR